MHPVCVCVFAIVSSSLHHFLITRSPKRYPPHPPLAFLPPCSLSFLVPCRRSNGDGEACGIKRASHSNECLISQHTHTLTCFVSSNLTSRNSITRNLALFRLKRFRACNLWFLSDFEKSHSTSFWYQIPPFATIFIRVGLKRVYLFPFFLSKANQASPTVAMRSPLSLLPTSQSMLQSKRNIFRNLFENASLPSK